MYSKLSNYSISINKSYSFGFLSGFYKRESINDFKRVILFYDESKKAIGFLFTKDSDAEGSFAIVHVGMGKGTTGLATARSFMLANNIDPKEYHGKWHPEKIQDDKLGNLFVIELMKSHANT